MDPIAINLGPIAIRWYGLLISLSLVLGTLISVREARRRGLDPDLIINLIIVVAPLAFVGARIYYVIFQWPYYSGNPGEIIAIWHGGLAFHGALIAGGLAAFLYLRRQGQNFWLAADILAPGLVLGQAIGRWGNFVNQEAYGYPTQLPWAMYIAGAYRHPTFLYESLWNLGIFALLIRWRQSPNYVNGRLFIIYLMLYSAGRFWIEGLRTDSLMLGPLRVAQVASAGIFLGAALLLWWRYRKARAGCEFN